MGLFRQAHGGAARVRGLALASVLSAVAAMVLILPLGAQDTTRARPDSAAAVPDTGRARDTTRAAAVDTAGTVPSEGQTHTVQKGETLWDLSHRYLNDPFLWPEIYRLNTDVVEDPHWIYPGEVLKIPSRAQFVAEDTLAPALRPEAVAVSHGPTVFSEALAQRRLVASRFGGTAAQYPHTAVRPGEFYTAPWVDHRGGPAGQGRLVAVADIPGIVQASRRELLFPQDRAYITAPDGVVLARGDRLMVFDHGPVVDGGGEVMIPTGIVEVERADNGGPSTVRVVEQFGKIALGQSVLPLARFKMSTEERPSPIMLGVEGTVIFIPTRTVLPSLQTYVILNTTAKDGVKVGDQFTLYRPRKRVEVPGESETVVLPEEAIALAQVVRVTDRGTTAIIVDQRQPAIREGVRARLTSRMP